MTADQVVATECERLRKKPTGFVYLKSVMKRQGILGGLVLVFVFLLWLVGGISSILELTGVL